MPRAFTAADVVQSSPGTATLTATPSVGLASPAVEGRSGILVIGAQTALAPPEQWHILAGAGTAAADLLAIMCRVCLPAADQSWAFATDNASTATWCWVAEEWDNVSYGPVQAASSTGQQISPASISTGTTGAFDAPYVAGLAAVLVTGAPGGSAWSAVSWSNGFTETDVQSVGTGTSGTDLQLRVARRYGTLNDAGAWETTATFTGGAQTGKTAYAALAVWRAANLAGDI